MDKSDHFELDIRIPKVGPTTDNQLKLNYDMNPGLNRIESWMNYQSLAKTVAYPIRNGFESNRYHVQLFQSTGQ